MTIWVHVEGKTETACRPVLKALLDEVAAQEGKERVGLRTHPYNGSEILDVDTVSRDAIDNLGSPGVAGAVVLVDVCPRFGSAVEAKEHYARCVGSPRFRAHCALHDFEAWLLPLWQRVYTLAGRPLLKGYPWAPPEHVDLHRPPSRVLRELFGPREGYQKTLHAPRILQTAQDLRTSAKACPELKAFLNTLLEFAGYDTRL